MTHNMQIIWTYRHSPTCATVTFSKVQRKLDSAPVAVEYMVHYMHAHVCVHTNAHTHIHTTVIHHHKPTNKYSVHTHQYLLSLSSKVTLLPGTLPCFHSCTEKCAACLNKSGYLHIYEHYYYYYYYYLFIYFIYTGGPPYPRVIRSKTYCSYMKPQIIPSDIYIYIYKTWYLCTIHKYGKV